MKESTRSRLEGYFGGDKVIGVSPLPLRVRNWLPHARAGDFSAQDKLPTPQPSVFGAPLPSLRHLSRDLIAYLFSTLPYQGSFCEPWDAPTVAVLISSKNRVRRLLPALHSNESNCENKKKKGARFALSESEYHENARDFVLGSSVEIGASTHDRFS